jgi:beta-galactosidase
VRRKDQKQYLFVLNYSRDAQKICLKKSVKDMDTGLTVDGEEILPPFGCRVYEI